MLTHHLLNLLLIDAVTGLSHGGIQHPNSWDEAVNEVETEINTKVEQFSSAPSRFQYGWNMFWGCFDGDTTLETPTGPKKVSEVAVGDEVLVATRDGQLVWDQIAVDASEGNVSTAFVRIETADGRSLSITGNHYLHASADEGIACCGPATLRLASDVSVGDVIWARNEQDDAGSLRATRVTRVRPSEAKLGAYNFLLAQNGDVHFRSLVANGIAASSFTSEWRLLDSFGFDTADRLRDPLRELSLLGAHTSGTLSLRDKDLLGVLVAMEKVTADCLEDHMVHDCSEAAVAYKFGMIEASAKRTLRPAVQDAVVTLVERLAEKHAGLLPSFARRLAVRAASATIAAAGSDTTTSFVLRVAAHEAHVLAASLCEADSRCAADLPEHARPGHVLVPVWSMPLLVVSGIVITLLLILLMLACWLLMGKTSKTSTTSAAAAQRTTVAPVDVNMASHNGAEHV